MRPQILIGVVVAVVIAAAAYVAGTLRSSAKQAAAQAGEEAELARRELHRYVESYALPHLQRAADPAALKEVDLEQLVEQTQDEFAALSQDFTRLVNQAQQSDRQLGRDVTELTALRASPGDVRSAVGGFEQLYSHHQALLEQAAKHAGEARRTGKQVLGVAHVAGMADYLKASRLLEEAQVLRNELREQQNHLLALTAGWKLTQADVDYYAGLDVSEILDGLQQDATELSELKATAVAQVDWLRQAVTEQKQALEQVREKLKNGRAALLTLEEDGFETGNDAAFEAYSRRYREIAEQLRGWQEQEHLLAKGGTRGGELVGDDPLAGELRGGDVVEGLEELERRLAVAEEKARRYADGETVVTTRIGHVRESGDIADGEHARYAARLEELRPQLDQVRAAAAEKHEAANAKEDEALRAAQAAVSAFKASDDAVNAWKKAASDLQRAKDPERRNERLKMIAADQFVPQLTQGAEGAANMLVARIHAQRVEAVSSYLAALEQSAAVQPGETVDSEQLETAIETAREEAVKSLNASVQIYEQLASGPASWLPRSSLAVAHYTLSTLITQPAQANEHMSQAVEAIRNAIQNEEWPFLDMQVRFREHLRAQGGQFDVAEPEPEEDDSAGQPPEDEG